MEEQMFLSSTIIIKRLLAVLYFSSWRQRRLSFLIENNHHRNVFFHLLIVWHKFIITAMTAIMKRRLRKQKLPQEDSFSLRPNQECHASHVKNWQTSSLLWLDCVVCVLQLGNREFKGTERFMLFWNEIENQTGFKDSMYLHVSPEAEEEGLLTLVTVNSAEWSGCKLDVLQSLSTKLDSLAL